MSVKTLRKQLFAAIAMVLVAAIALGSSTYAWFASNNSVEAKAMKITAQTEGANLEVSFEKGNFTPGSIAVTSTSTATLLPTHYVTSDDAANTSTYGNTSNPITAGKWAHAYSREYNSVYTDKTYTEATEVEAVGTLSDSVSYTDYALVVPVYLRLNDQSKNQMNNIRATVEIVHSDADDGNSVGMTTAGRVAFITEDGKSTKAILDTKAYVTGETTTSAVANITAAGNAGAKVVYVVIYFDGDDNTCKSSQFETDNYTVNLTFTGTMGGAIS